EIALDALAIPGEHRAAAAARQARIHEQPADRFQRHRPTFGTPDRPLIVIAEHGPRLTRTTASAEASSSEYDSHSLPARKDCAMKRGSVSSYLAVAAAAATVSAAAFAWMTPAVTAARAAETTGGNTALMTQPLPD